MSEADAIAVSDLPVTSDSLVENFIRIGLRPGQIVLVHSSLSSLGWVCGAAVAVIEALMRVLGSQGTLVMPTYTSGLSEPAHWQRPPVPASWCATIRAALPPFDRHTTPSRGMGAIVEFFRTCPGVTRSDHPTSSMSALGPRARDLLCQHPLDDPQGEASPLGRLYDSGAKVLLLGVGHNRNTSLHLAERKAFRDRQARMRTGSPMFQGGQRRWIEYDEPQVTSDDFELLGTAFESAPNRVSRTRVGAGTSRFMDQRELVDFGVDWLTNHRDETGKPRL